VPPEMFHFRHNPGDFRHNPGTDPCARGGYGVCRGPGGPLGGVWGAFA
jgi:hypothetical protein